MEMLKTIEDLDIYLYNELKSGWFHIHLEENFISYDFEGQYDVKDCLYYANKTIKILKKDLKIKKFEESLIPLVKKIIKSFELWRLDFLCLEDKENHLHCGNKNRELYYEEDYHLDFEIMFDKILKLEERISKDKSFLKYILKKEHMFENLKHYSHMFYDTKNKILILKFIEYTEIIYEIKIKPYISNKKEHYEIFYKNLKKYKYISEDNFSREEYIGEDIENLKDISDNIKKIKNILNSSSYKTYLKSKKN